MEQLSTKIAILGRNFPNPLDHNTVIPFSLPETSRVFDVTLSIIDVNGRIVTIIADGKFNPGFHQVEWNLTNNIGQSLKKGLYLYRIDIQSDNTSTSQTRTLIIK